MLPPLYAAWAEALLGEAVPEEHGATCDRCAMWAPVDGAPARGATYFTEGKCCTYRPQLWSFLAGGILADPAPELARARAEVERVVAGGAGVTPEGLLGPRSYWLLYGKAAFGRSRSLRCPLFDVSTGSCGAWRHRESTCATWFCKHDRGAVGGAFWSALAALLRHLEQQLATDCAIALGVGEEALAALAEDGGRPADAEDLDGVANPERRRRVWGAWAGRELAYYRTCAERVARLTWPEVLAQGGAQGRALAAVARSRFAALRESAPPAGALRPGSWHQVATEGGVARVRTYAEFDPLEVPLPLLAALARFDGRSTAEVVAEIAARDRLEVTPELVRTLVDYELLVPRGAP